MKCQAEARKALNTHRINYELLHLGKIELRASARWRAVEVLGGIIVIALAFYELADPQFTIQTLVIAIASGLVLVLLIVGNRNIVHGYTGHHPVATPIGPALTAV